ncbi:hypothetical protein QBC44DRAFT_302828 [Cladorrhinum sp. PSN332]|nr:hypothetical protein QBC44DRAFT_302828 [Cladorrhinum sp. PSN332]
MIKTTTRSARRLGTKLLGSPPRRRTGDGRGNRTSSGSQNLVALSRQRPDRNSKQPEPIQADNDRDPLPKRWQRGHDLRNIHDQSNSAGDRGEGATNNGDESGKMNSFKTSSSSTSYTNHPRSNGASNESPEGIVPQTAVELPPSVKLDTFTAAPTRSRPSLKPLNTVRGRHQQLLDLEAQQKRTAIERYKATGDPAHFLPFLGPFISTDDRNNNKAEHEEWQWDKESERHWREGGKATGTRIWAPVKESFI